MNEIVVVYVTMPSAEKAREMIRALLEEHIIACATIIPCQSMYWWDNAIQEDQECIIFAKTAADKFELVKQEITKIHPYKVPCILKLSACANAPYAQWVNAEMKPK